mmetsp:Transcript_41615/g.54814  ORF Transcript_41615/g.54814 Transcript_41615/m.54814 type:complete len:145 (-) Transcript_41615:73-507(-)
MSGITAHEECVLAYNTFKLQNSTKGEKFRYIIFRIKDEKIKIDKKGAHTETWEDFVDALAAEEKDGAYGICDFHTTNLEGRQFDKIIFVQWTPDTLPVRSKMLYGSTCEAFKGELGNGIAHAIQASGVDDLDEDDIVSMVTKGN